MQKWGKYYSLLSEKSEADWIKLVSESIVPSNKDDDYDPRQGVKNVAANIPPRVRTKAEKCKEEPRPVKPWKPKNDPVAAPTKAGKPKNDSIPVKTVIAGKMKPKRLNGNNVRMTNLPEFTKQKWQTTFLPMLYDKFFASDQPFDTFNIGSDQFVDLLQAVINEVYPDIEYKVTSSSSIHFLVCCFPQFYLCDIDFFFLGI